MIAAPFLEVMAQDSALPVCDLIARLPFQWAPPRTSSYPLYEEHSNFKAHVELLGPTGLLASSKVRIGLYGMLPHCEYGLRTHPAEETYIMLAGSAFWKVANTPYQGCSPDSGRITRPWCRTPQRHRMTPSCRSISRMVISQRTNTDISGCRKM